MKKHTFKKSSNFQIIYHLTDLEQNSFQSQEFQLSAPVAVGETITSTFLFTPEYIVLLVNNVLVHKTVWNNLGSCKTAWSEKLEDIEFTMSDNVSKFYKIICE